MESSSVRERRIAGGLVSGILAVSILLASAALPAVAGSHQQWPSWRGPVLTGATEASNLPADWSDEEGILWTAPLPGSGNSTPVIWGDRIFLTAADAETDELLALCLDAETGAILWQHEHGQNRQRHHNDHTSPSAVTDGERVIFMFGTGELVAYDFAGERLWQRDLEEDFGLLTWLFGYGASPLLHEGRLYVQMMRRPTPPWRGAPPLEETLDSFLLAVDPATGQDLWQQVRPGEAVAESWESYITPTVHPSADGDQILMAGADALTGHDAETGEELWRYSFNETRRRNWRLVPTPASDGERVFMALPRGVSLAAVKPSRQGVPLEEHAEWTMPDFAPDVCSLTLYEGRLYVLDGDRRVLTCLDPTTGEQLWRGELGGDTVIRSSPTAADGKIYFMDERGVVFVVAAGGDEFRLLSRIEMGGRVARSSIAIAADQLYVRTADALYCIGAPAD